MAETRRLIITLLVFLDNCSLTDSKVILPDANVTCIIQDDCILPCSFRPTATVVIHWYKQQIPVHSYYYNKDQFGLQNKHFSGRTSLFNSHIAHGNASLLLRRVKVQDKGRYKCYTSTRKVNQEAFINLDVKAFIQSVVIERTDEMVTCSSHSIYPVPQVAWATEPPSVQEARENSTIKTTDSKGLFTVESTLRIVASNSSYTYFCSFVSADKTQVWTASHKNQDVTQEEGRALFIPCISPHSLQNFSLTWSFTSSGKPTVIMRYDSRTRHAFNLWEDRAELDQELLLLGNGSLLLHKPDREEHSGMYTCTFLGLQSRDIIQTTVNITVALISVDERRVQRSWWSTAASVAFVLVAVIVALPQCVRQRVMETRIASHRGNGAGFVEHEPHKDPNATDSHITGRHADDCNGPQGQLDAQDDMAQPAGGISAASDSEGGQRGNAAGPVEGSDGPQCSGEDAR